MAATRNDVAENLPAESLKAASDKGHSLWDLGFQFSLVCFFLASAVHLFSPDASSLAAYRQYVLWTILGCTIPVCYWIICSKIRGIIKASLILAAVIVALIKGTHAVSEFDRANKILAPPELRDGRFVQAALGLSYAKLPDCEHNLVPKTMSTAKKTDDSVPGRMRFGQRVRLHQMTLTRSTAEREFAPTMINFEVACIPIDSLDTFVRNIKNLEADWRSGPTVRIVRSTHGSWHHGRELLEFEVFETRLKLTTRFAYFHEGNFLLTFVFTTTREADRQIFDDFLKSIRFGPKEETSGR